MSRKVEKAVGGLVQSLFGNLGGSGNFLGSPLPPTATQPSLPFLAFLEKARDAKKISAEVFRIQNVLLIVAMSYKLNYKEVICIA